MTSTKISWGKLDLIDFLRLKCLYPSGLLVNEMVKRLLLFSQNSAPGLLVTRPHWWIHDSSHMVYASNCYWAQRNCFTNMGVSQHLAPLYRFVAILASWRRWHFTKKDLTELWFCAEHKIISSRMAQIFTGNLAKLLPRRGVPHLPWDARGEDLIQHVNPQVACTRVYSLNFSYECMLPMLRGWFQLSEKSYDCNFLSRKYEDWVPHRLWTMIQHAVFLNKLFVYWREDIQNFAKQ